MTAASQVKAGGWTMLVLLNASRRRVAYQIRVRVRLRTRVLARDSRLMSCSLCSKKRLSLSSIFQYHPALMRSTNSNFAHSYHVTSKTSFPSSVRLLAVVFCLLSAVLLRAEDILSSPGASEGEKLERQMAADIKAKNWNAVESKIADGFQSVHPDGPRDRASEIELLKKMNFGDFTLSNFKSTVIGDNIVVTFTMRVAQTIDGNRLPPRPAYRLSVWKKGPNGWQWISHTNLAPIL